ncbi:hypothetical protein QVD17_39314 [Tagetes erecta]|uniref:Uncharacterized protein n=1 Tax=Tagetes erecta TaxID=13708 RepID=A0AAD8JNC4_TARER|nr:hypothetical protein QVD17_39314 [Tagetes erecta]
MTFRQEGSLQSCLQKKSNCGYTMGGEKDLIKPKGARGKALVATFTIDTEYKKNLQLETTLSSTFELNPEFLQL